MSARIGPDTQAAFNAIVALALVPFSHAGDVTAWVCEHGVTSKQIADKYGSTVNDVHEQRLQELVDVGMAIRVPLDGHEDRYAVETPF